MTWSETPRLRALASMEGSFWSGNPLDVTITRRGSSLSVLISCSRISNTCGWLNGSPPETIMTRGRIRRRNPREASKVLEDMCWPLRSAETRQWGQSISQYFVIRRSMWSRLGVHPEKSELPAARIEGEGTRVLQHEAVFSAKPGRL